MENTTLNLEIIAPDTSEKFSIEWVEIESPTGSFLVGPDHSPLISMIKQKSIIIYKKEKGEKVSLDAAGGIFKVINNDATILLDR